jgi:hypothetical protein
MMTRELSNHPDYDFPTAVTFLFAGLAIGTILTLLFFPLSGSSEELSSARHRDR